MQVIAKYSQGLRHISVGKDSRALPHFLNRLLPNKIILHGPLGSMKFLPLCTSIKELIVENDDKYLSGILGCSLLEKVETRFAFKDFVDFHLLKNLKYISFSSTPNDHQMLNVFSHPTLSGIWLERIRTLPSCKNDNINNIYLRWFSLQNFEAFQDFGALKELNVWNGPKLTSLKGLPPSLESLHLSATSKLNDYSALSGLQNLTYLNIESCDIFPTEIYQLHSLSTMFIASKKAIGADWEKLFTFPKMSRLSIMQEGTTPSESYFYQLAKKHGKIITEMSVEGTKKTPSIFIIMEPIKADTLGK